MNTESTRPRGVLLYKMPEEVNGKGFYPYALMIRESDDLPTEARMVNTEGVAYLVTVEKDWCWTDYNPNEKRWSLEDLFELCDKSNTVDLADWVRTFGSRLESNFWLAYEWAKS